MHSVLACSVAARHAVDCSSCRVLSWVLCVQMEEDFVKANPQWVEKLEIIPAQQVHAVLGRDSSCVQRLGCIRKSFVRVQMEEDFMKATREWMEVLEMLTRT